MIQQIERREITLSCIQNDEPVSVRTMARVCNGLALHRGIGKDKLYRTLTHLESSLPLVTGIRLPADEQDAILIELAGLMDWHQGYGNIISQWAHNPTLMQDVQRLYRKLHGESEAPHD